MGDGRLPVGRDRILRLDVSRLMSPFSRLNRRPVRLLGQ